MAKAKKVPKRIAGVKLPKPLRRGLRDLTASQNGRKVLAEALGAAGAALAASQVQSQSKTRKTTRRQPPKSTTADKLRTHGSELRAATVSALEDAARSFTDTLRRRGAPEPPPPSSTSTH